MASASLTPMQPVTSQTPPLFAQPGALNRLMPDAGMPDTGLREIIQSIRELHRQRDDLLRTEGDLTRRIKSIHRRSANALLTPVETLPTDDDPFLSGAGHHCFDAHGNCADPLNPTGEDEDQDLDVHQNVIASSFAAPALVAAHKTLKSERMKVEKLLSQQAQRLPVYRQFVEPIKGFGAVGLAQIIGECGDLSNYANPAKVWKRLGLAVIQGERQRRYIDAAKALLHGYSPRRRSVVYVIAFSLFMKDNAYRDWALVKKEELTAKYPERKKGHIHADALRRMSKNLLRDLWKAWNNA